MSRVFSNSDGVSTQIGWGANCNRHCDEGERRAVPNCKKQLVYGDKTPLTDEQCKLQLKRWLVAGLNLAGPQQRKDHVCLNARR